MSQHADRTEQSESVFAAARAADEQGGQFDVATVFLALSLFSAASRRCSRAWSPRR